jgi:hypothetical protein
MLVFSSYIARTQKIVELNDLEKRTREEKDMEKVKDYKDNIKKLRADLETDTLPNIDIAIAKRTN